VLFVPNQLLGPHYDAVVPIVAEGRVVPFLGAGVNCAGRAPGAVWKEPGAELPNGRELAGWLAHKVGLGEQQWDLVRVSQYMETTLGPGELYLRVRQALNYEARITPVHEFLAALPRRLRAASATDPRLEVEDTNLLIVTTNYDDTMERALQLAGEPYDVVSYVATGIHAGTFVHVPSGEEDPRRIEVPNEYVGVSVAEQTVVLKLHGALHREQARQDSFVITEDNYIDYLATSDPLSVLPVTLAEKLQSSHLLFLGYGLQDWNLRVILRRLWGAQELGFTSWAVQLQPDEVEQRYWQNRNVEINDADLVEYVTELSERLARVLRERRGVGEGAVKSP
jgi:SIR2-like domain